MTRLFASLLLVATLAFGAHAQEAEPNEVRDFVSKAMISNTLEIETSRLAIDKASTPEIKAFAQQMIGDHEKLIDQLQATVRAIGANEVTGSLDASHRDELNALNTRRGAEFDQAYIDGQIKLHNEAVALFRDYARTGTNPQLKALAEEALPVIEGHLQHAQSLQ